MGAVSKVTLVALRIWQFVSSVIVLGILARFLHYAAMGGAARDGRIIYGIIVASISTVFSLVFIAPLTYAFLAFPADFALFVAWLVAFCLLISVSCWRYILVLLPKDLTVFLSEPAHTFVAQAGSITGHTTGAGGGGALGQFFSPDAARGGLSWPFLSCS